MAEELECDKRVELNKDGKPASVEATGNTAPAARAKASAEAEQAAVTAARRRAQDYVCKKGCPVRRFDFKIGEPSVAAPAFDAVLAMYKTSATCEWNASLTCVEEPVKDQALGLQPQKFVCTDDFTRIFEGEVTGKEIDNVLPSGWREEAALLFTLLNKLYGDVTLHLWDVLEKIHCPHRCKNKIVRVWIWPDATDPVQSGPDANGWFTWTTTVWVRIDAKCSD